MIPFSSEEIYRASCEELLLQECYKKLQSIYSEMYMLIDEVNDQRASKINSLTETPPDYHDQQTLWEIQELMDRLKRFL